MSKSVLVINTPKYCALCVLRSGVLYPFCRVDNRDITDLSIRPNWCPLKPLPEKKEYIVPIDNVESQKDIIAVGWNACLREITETSDKKRAIKSKR